MKKSDMDKLTQQIIGDEFYDNMREAYPEIVNIETPMTRYGAPFWPTDKNRLNQVSVYAAPFTDGPNDFVPGYPQLIPTFIPHDEPICTDGIVNDGKTILPSNMIDTTQDPVNHPIHYTLGIETIEYITSWGMDFLAGNVIKYVTRHSHKGKPLEDLKKAQFYLNKLIEKIEKNDK